MRKTEDIISFELNQNRTSFTIKNTRFDDVALKNKYYSLSANKNQIIISFSNEFDINSKESYKKGRRNNVIVFYKTAMKLINGGEIEDGKIVKYELYTNDKDKIVLKKI